MVGAISYLRRNTGSENRLAAPLVTGVIGAVVSFEFIAGVDVVFDASPGNTSPWSHCVKKEFG